MPFDLLTFFILLYAQFNFILYWICFKVPINCVKYAYFFMVSFYFFHICDSTKLKGQHGCVLTNPPNANAFASRLHIYRWIFNVITYKIADFNSYHLRFHFRKSINKCGTETQGLAFGVFVKTQPSRYFYSVT